MPAPSASTPSLGPGHPCPEGILALYEEFLQRQKQAQGQGQFSDDDVNININVDQTADATGGEGGSGQNDNGDRKVEICHDGQTLEVSVNALPAHYGHGDTLGPCPPVIDAGVTTATPPTEAKTNGSSGLPNGIGLKNGNGTTPDA